MFWLGKIVANSARVFKTIRYVRAPLFVGILSLVSLSLPSQMREVYRILAQNWIGSDWWSSATFQVAGIFIISLVVMVGFWICVQDLALHPIKTDLDGARHARPSPNNATKYLPASVSAFAPLGLAIGIWWAANELETSTFRVTSLENHPDFKKIFERSAESSRLLRKSAIIYLGIALLPFLLRWLPQIPLISNVRLQTGRKFRLSLLIPFVTIVSFFIALYPVFLGQALGTSFLVLNFFLLFMLICTILSRFGDQIQIPILTILVFFAAIFSLTGLNNNHVVKPSELPTNKIAQLGTISGSVDIKDAPFLSWLKSRTDKVRYKEKPYPVFIVAAAGGGLYAAHHTASVLARIQDHCPQFAQHVFAISGVSGGSLGAAVFSGLVRHRTQNDVSSDHTDKSCVVGVANPSVPYFEPKVREFFKTDFLSPLVASTLYRDLPQRFWFIPNESLDRALQLEKSFISAWDQLLPGRKENIFQIPFSQFWNSQGVAPALMLNSTDLDNGVRVVMSPMMLQNWPIGMGETRHHKNTALTNFYVYSGLVDEEFRIRHDIDVGKAISLSSRFPWILPAGTILRCEPPFKGSGDQQCLKELLRNQTEEADNSTSWETLVKPHKLRLVDGGYFDNSGAETAIDLIHQLSRYFEVDEELVSDCETFIRNAREEQGRKTNSDKDSAGITTTVRKFTDQIEICTNMLESRRFLREVDLPQGVRIHLVLIDVDSNLSLGSAFSGSEFLSPLIGLLSSWQRRGQLSNLRATMNRVPCWDEVFKFRECDASLVIHMKLHQQDFDLPLGWQLSSDTLDLIGLHSGTAERGGFLDGTFWYTNDEYSDDLMSKDSGACAILLLLDGQSFGDWNSGSGSPSNTPCGRATKTNNIRPK